MAHMIPAEPKEFDARSHEGIVFEALKKLPDSYYVFHSVETVAVTDTNELLAKETDFLVVNKQLGALTIEVKAGDGIYYEDGQWHYTSGLLMPHGGPYRQARTASATLRRLVKDHTNPAVASMVNHIKFVSAVWFPDMAQEFPIVKDTTPNMMNPRLYTTSYNKPQGQQFDDTAVLSFIKLQYT